MGVVLGIISTAAFFNLRRKQDTSFRTRLEIMYYELVISFSAIILLTGGLMVMSLKSEAYQLGLILQGFVILRLFRRSWFDRRAPVMSVMTTIIFFAFSVYWFKAVLPNQVLADTSWWYFLLGVGLDGIIFGFKKFRRSSTPKVKTLM